MTSSELNKVDLQDLIAPVRAEDRATEDRLVRAVLARFHNLARRMLHRFPDLRYLEQTGDVVQESMIRLLRALRAVTPSTTRDLFNLAAEQIRRQLLDLARHHRRLPMVSLQLPSDSSAEGLRPADPVTEGDLDRWASFHSAVERLPPEEREVMGLSFYHGWTQAQIALLFQVDERTIRRRWRAACLTLTEAVGGQLPPSN